MYEHHTHPLISRAAFLKRLMNHGLVAFSIIGVSLFIGVIFYHALGPMPWIDALLNAAMILGGEGPVDRLTTPAAKIFASAYALYSGLVLLAVAGILLAPVIHRVFHRFHLEKSNNDKGDI